MHWRCQRSTIKSSCFHSLLTNRILLQVVHTSQQSSVRTDHPAIELTLFDCRLRVSYCVALGRTDKLVAAVLMFPSTVTNNSDADDFADVSMFHNDSHPNNDTEKDFGFFGSLLSPPDSTPAHSSKTVIDDTGTGICAFEGQGRGLVFGRDHGGAYGINDDNGDGDASMMPPPPPVDKENSNKDTPITANTSSKKFQSFLVSVHEELEASLVAHQQTTKRFFVALEEWSQTAAQVHAAWMPLQAAEHAEADRLATLQGEVHGSVQALFGNSAGDADVGL